MENTRCTSENHVPIVAGSNHTPESDESSKASGPATSTTTEDGKPQHVNNFNDVEELSRLCERAVEAQRTGVPFVLPSRNALLSDAAHPGAITEDQVAHHCTLVLLGRLSQPDPENRLLSDICELLGCLDTSRHFGDNNPDCKKLNIADREVLIFWDYTCLYHKSDATTDSVAARQLRAGPRVDQRLVLSRRDAVPAMHRELSSGDAHRVHFESLVSTMVKDQDRAAHRAQLVPQCWQRHERTRQQQEHLLVVRTREAGAKLRPNTPRTAAT